MELERIQKGIKRLYDRYSRNREVLRKMILYTEEQLPEFLDSYEQRLKRKETLERESEAYINGFMNDPKRQYFYIQISDIYVQYDGKHYSIADENDILHTILSEISLNKTLIAWKYKVKTIIMKRIKEQNLLQSIPESYTIQFVLERLTPVLLGKRDQAKYFLTVVGDNILKKHANLIHLLSPLSKDFVVRLLEAIHTYYRNTNKLDTTFKYKYYGYNYGLCRVVNFNASVCIPDYWEAFAKTHILDILAVAAHYSGRYTCADNYIREHGTDESVKEEILYLEKRSETDIIDKFIENCLCPSESSISISWNDMYYLWKSYLRTHNLPTLVFIKNLKAHLQKELEYDPAGDKYVHVTSSMLSYIRVLKNFWDENVTDAEDEFEINELCSLYAKYLDDEKILDRRIGESDMLSIIRHFYDVNIVDDKYLIGIGCLLWNKRDEMLAALEHLRLSYSHSESADGLSLHRVYRDYCNSSAETGRIVSKSYFQKYISQVIPSKYIKSGKLLSSYWLD